VSKKKVAVDSVTFAQGHQIIGLKFQARVFVDRKLMMRHTSLARITDRTARMIFEPLLAQGGPLIGPFDLRLGSAYYKCHRFALGLSSVIIPAWRNSPRQACLQQA
jgi:hypothetical protein